MLYPADNLDEPDQHGYCLDTVGRGQSDRAHLHSCKPRGGDVQFRFDPATGQIQSATFDDICLDVADERFALMTCNNASSQKFAFSDTTGEIRPLGNPGTCLASAPTSRQAGPFVARDLALSVCEDTPEALKTWVQR